MSNRIIRSSSPNRTSASVLRELGLARRRSARGTGSCRSGGSGRPSPARPRRTASATASTASSWPITRSCRRSSSFRSRSRSSCGRAAETGMPVARETTSAMSSTVTSGARWRPCFCPDSCVLLRRSASSSSFALLVVLRSRPPGRARARGGRSPPPAPSCRRGLVLARRRTRAEAWSMRSIALSGQEPVADVAVGQLGGRDDRLVRDAHPVERLVPVLQPVQDLDRLLDGGLADQHRLEPPLERRVLLDVLAVLVDRRRADHVELAARERGLQHVRGVHRRPRRAPAPTTVCSSSMKTISWSLLSRDLVDHGLQALLELAAVLRAGDHPGQVERDQPSPGERLGNLVVHDALGDALDDRGLADAGVADQHRVVLRAPREDLDRLLDLVGPPDHRVELALAGELRSGRGCTGRASWWCSAACRLALAIDAADDRAPQLGVREPEPPKDLAGLGVLVPRERQQDVFRPDVRGAELARLLVRGRGSRAWRPATARATRRRGSPLSASSSISAAIGLRDRPRPARGRARQLVLQRRRAGGGRCPGRGCPSPRPSARPAARSSRVASLKSSVTSICSTPRRAAARRSARPRPRLHHPAHGRVGEEPREEIVEHPQAAEPRPRSTEPRTGLAVFGEVDLAEVEGLGWLSRTDPLDRPDGGPDAANVAHARHDALLPAGVRGTARCSHPPTGRCAPAPLSWRRGVPGVSVACPACRRSTLPHAPSRSPSP